MTRALGVASPGHYRYPPSDVLGQLVDFLGEVVDLLGQAVFDASRSSILCVSS